MRPGDLGELMQVTNSAWSSTVTAAETAFQCHKSDAVWHIGFGTEPTGYANTLQVFGQQIFKVPSGKTVYLRAVDETLEINVVAL